MAGYRPKSLDELNSLYGKSMEAANEIKKSENRIENQAKPVESGFDPEKAAEALLEATAAQDEKVTDEISSLVNDFSKKFGTEEKENVSSRPQPVSISVQSRPRPVKGPAKVKPESEKASFELKGEEAPKQDKPKLIRNSERSDLFENYKRIMDDDDESGFSGGRSKRKQKKLKGDKKQVNEEADNIATAQENPLAAESQPSEAEKAVEETAESIIAAVNDEPHYIIQPLEDIAEPSDEDNQDDSDNEGKAEAFDENSAESKKAQKNKKSSPKAKKGSGAQIVLMVVLLFVMLAATCVGSVKTVFAVNTSQLVFGSYRIYTADTDFSAHSIEKGSLVITVDRDIKSGDSFAYETDSGEIRYAKHSSTVNNEGIIPMDGASDSFIFNDELRGAVSGIYPVVGTVASFISDNFLTVLIVLLSIAVLIVLILAFSFKGKGTSNGKKELFSSADDEEEDEDVFTLTE